MARLLVVDDDRDASALFRRWLERAGHEVAESFTGEGALRNLANASFELVLLDVFLPGIGGYEVARRMSEDPDLSSVPVLMISAAEREARPEPPNIKDWMSKPFTSSELVGAVERLTRRVDG